MRTDLQIAIALLFLSSLGAAVAFYMEWSRAVFGALVAGMIAVEGYLLWDLIQQAKQNQLARRRALLLLFGLALVFTILLLGRDFFDIHPAILAVVIVAIGFLMDVLAGRKPPESPPNP
jgi:hypothetical protein